VGEALVGEPGRLDAVVARLLGEPRSVVQRAIDVGGILVDGAPRTRSFRLAGGERIEVEIAPSRSVAPEGPPVDVRYEDEQLLVVAKPEGMVTHPTERRRSGTLVNRLLGMGVPLSGLGGPLRPGIVHRLDAGTSGLMMVAKTDRAHEALARMLRRHEVDRRYLALVRGGPTTCSRWTHRWAGAPRRSSWTEPAAAHRSQQSRCESGSRGPRCSRPRRKRAERTRSGCTLRRSATRYSATARTAGPGTMRDRSAWHVRSFTRGGSRSCTPSTAPGSSSRSLCRATSSARSPVSATRALDGLQSPAYLGHPRITPL
jgi:16S rRNA U516 pseudouridylate synthase RsuA-like enzyme